MALVHPSKRKFKTVRTETGRVTSTVPNSIEIHPDIKTYKSILYVAFSADARDDEVMKLANLDTRLVIQPNDQQRVILNFGLSDNCHLQVDARAGCGKTTIANELIARMIEINPAIKAEAKSYHQLGLAYIRCAGYSTGRAELEKGKASIWQQLDEAGLAIPRTVDYNGRTILNKLRGQAKKLVGYVKNGCTDTDEETLQALCDANDITVDRQYWARVVVAVQQCVDMSMDIRRWGIGFDDMIHWPARTGKMGTLQLGWQKPDFAIIDEYQDTNTAQEQMLRMLLAEGVRVMIIGDEYQCQPVGTVVSVTGGEDKPIQSVNVGDQLVSYNSRKTWFPGVRVQGRKVLGVASREFNGELVKVETEISGLVSRYTDQHRCLVKFTDLNRHCLYAMRRGNRARLGTCRLMYNSGSGLSFRARAEKADDAWILAVYSSNEEARMMEDRIASKFGIPELIFENTNQPFPPQDYIDGVYDWLEAHDDMLGKLQKCLCYFGRDFEYPIWSSNNGNPHMGVKSFIVRACNLVNNGMLVKTFDGDQRGSKWERIEVTREPYKGLVYSLDVEPCEDGRKLYVADGIVTHNSIYGFRSANSGAMERGNAILKATGREVKRLPMTYTNRCPDLVVELDKEIVPDFQCLPGTRKGKLGLVQDKDLIEFLQPGDLVLCRNNADLVALAFRLVKARKPVKIKGRDLGTSLCEIVDEAVMAWPGDVVSGLRAWFDKKSQPLIRLGEEAEERLARLQDKMDCLMYIAQEGLGPDEIKEVVAGVFDDTLPDIMIKLSTVHKIKGGQAKRVIALRPDRLGLSGKKAEDAVQERNVLNVLITRAMEELYFVPSKGEKGIVTVPHSVVRKWRELTSEKERPVDERV